MIKAPVPLIKLAIKSALWFERVHSLCLEKISCCSSLMWWANPGQHGTLVGSEARASAGLMNPRLFFPASLCRLQSQVKAAANSASYLALALKCPANLTGKCGKQPTVPKPVASVQEGSLYELHVSSWIVTYKPFETKFIPWLTQVCMVLAHFLRPPRPSQLMFFRAKALKTFLCLHRLAPFLRPAPLLKACHLHGDWYLL